MLHFPFSIVSSCWWWDILVGFILWYFYLKSFIFSPWSTFLRLRSYWMMIIEVYVGKFWSVFPFLRTFLSTLKIIILVYVHDLVFSRRHVPRAGDEMFWSVSFQSSFTRQLLYILPEVLFPYAYFLNDGHWSGKFILKYITSSVYFSL